MDFISETTFKSPIKGGMPSTVDNDKGDLVIDSNLRLIGNLCESGNFNVVGDLEVSENHNASITGNLTVGHTATLNNLTATGTTDLGATTADNLTVTGSTKLGYTTTADSLVVRNITMGKACGEGAGSICVYNEMAVYSGMRFIKGGVGTYDHGYWTLYNAGGRLMFNYPSGGGEIDICGNFNVYGTLSVPTNGITLAEEKITSWSDLAQYVSGGGETSPKIKRFTSPEVPQNCSQFYFEGTDTVTGTELPFIQVRETDTGKLVQMDVWVNLDEACTGFTLGKPVAEIEPCSTASTDAGKWTAIVMN